MNVDTGINGVDILTVESLYDEYKRMDVPEYYEDGQENPYAGRCRVIPRKATFYTMVPQADEGRVAMARLLLKGVGKRRKVREAVCDKGEVNFNQFVKAGKIVVLYV